MIKKIKKIITREDDNAQAEAQAEAIAAMLLQQKKEPDLRVIGLFAEVEAEKIAEICHAMLYLNEVNALEPIVERRRPIMFYLSTYGGNADDMFALYDLMRVIRTETPIQTVGLGKVMSAGVLLLAAGSKGHRYVGKNCRVMIHAVMGGNAGSLHTMINEMGAMERLQESYSRCLVEETDLTTTKLKELLESKVNTYLTAEEAVEYGIADHII